MIPGLAPALARLLDADDMEATAVQVLAVDAQDQEVLLLELGVDDGTVCLGLGDDLSGLQLAPDALPRIATAPAEMRLGALGQLRPDQLQAVVAGVVGSTFGLPNAHHSVKAALAGPVEEDAAGVPGLREDLDTLLGAVAPGRRACLSVLAEDDQSACALLALWRNEDGALALILPGDVDLPEDLALGRALRQRLRQDLGLDADRDGSLLRALGDAADFDPEDLADLLAEVLDAAFGALDPELYALGSQLDVEP